MVVFQCHSTFSSHSISQACSPICSVSILLQACVSNLCVEMWGLRPPVPDPLPDDDSGPELPPADDGPMFVGVSVAVPDPLPDARPSCVLKLVLPRSSSILRGKDFFPLGQEGPHPAPNMGSAKVQKATVVLCLPEAANLVCLVQARLEAGSQLQRR